MSPLITLIVPFYQNLGSISATLYSITKALQFVNSESVELLFVNNNSSDGTANAVSDYVAKVSGSILIHEKNQGVSHARNSGVGCAKGNYIAFLDADDELEESFFSVILHAISFKPDLIFCKHQFVDGEVPFEECSPKYLLDKDLSGWWNCQFIFKKSLAFDLNFEGGCFEDFGFFPIILARTRNCVVLRQHLYWYNENPLSLTKRSVHWRISELEGQFNKLCLSSDELGVDIYKKVRRDFYEHISLLRAIAGYFPVLGLFDSLALIGLSGSFRGRFYSAGRLFKLNSSTLYRLLISLIMR